MTQGSPTTGELVASIAGIAAQLERMASGSAYVQDGFVRVLDPPYLIDKLRATATALTTLERELEEARASNSALADMAQDYADRLDKSGKDNWAREGGLEIALGQTKARVAQLETQLEGALANEDDGLAWDALKKSKELRKTVESALTASQAEVERLRDLVARFLHRFELYAGLNDMHAGHHDLELLTAARAAIQVEESKP